VADVSGADRGVSTVVGYVLNLGVALLLVTGLLVATSGFVEQQRHNAVQTQLQVVGERLVGDLATADNVANASGGGGRAVVRADLPTSVTGQSYTVTVTDVGGGVTRVRLRADGGVTVTRRIHTALAATNVTVSGGRLRVVADGGTLEVSRD